MANIDNISMHGHQLSCIPADLDRFLHTTNRLSLINCAAVLIDNEIDPDINAFDVHETTIYFNFFYLKTLHEHCIYSEQ